MKEIEKGGVLEFWDPYFSGFRNVHNFGKRDLFVFILEFYNTIFCTYIQIRQNLVVMFQ